METEAITLEAADAPTELKLRATLPIDIRAAEAEGKRPRFDIVGYTGAPVYLSNFYSPVIVDLAGLRAASQQIPALRGHDVDRIVGQTDAVKIDASGVRLEGAITGDNGDAQEVVSQAKNGFKWQASIGATIDRREFLDAGKRATVNGREVSGPMVIAREATLKEISFVALGADGQTSASVAASDPSGTHQGSAMNFDQWLQAKGFDPAALNDTQKATLRASFDAEQAAQAGANSNANGGNTQAPPPGNGGGTVNAGGGQTVAGTRTLEEILAEQGRERARVSEITAIADRAMQERPLMLDAIGEMARAAIEQKKSALEFKLAVFEAQMQSPQAPAVHAKAGLGSRKDATRVVEAALCMAGGLDGVEKHYDERTLDAASAHFKGGVTLCEVLLMAARENGYSGHSARDVEGLLRAAFARNQIQAAGGFSSLSLPGILSNTANKFLTMGFNAVEMTWRAIAARKAVRDFKQVSTYALTGGFQYEKLGASGELKHATAGELTYTNQADTYGKMFAITRRDIINDDLGALTEVPRRLGRGAALSLNDVFWTAFLNNGSFFTSGNDNYFDGATSALGIASLTTAETMFMDQTDPDGYPVSISPKILLTPNGLNVTASNLMNSTEVRDTTANTLIATNNPHAGKFTTVRSSYLSNSSYTGNSSTAWYLLADPNDVAVIEVAFLNGREEPTVDSADADFNVLGIQMRGYFDFGVALQEYRAGVKSKGAA